MFFESKTLHYQKTLNTLHGNAVTAAFSSTPLLPAQLASASAFEASGKIEKGRPVVSASPVEASGKTAERGRPVLRGAPG
ncbi:MAG TPA: hypothetical protein VLH15_00300 [Dehalococcoidales bacterium]|nr:hypothetical protein [Dehalococcoidales bacterium]